MSFYISQEKMASVHGYAGGRVLVRYYVFRAEHPFESDCDDLKQALKLVDTLRRYDSHHRFDKRPATYRPFAELVQASEDGGDHVFGVLDLPGEPPWVRR